MSKPSLTDRINSAIEANDTQTGRIPMGKGPSERAPVRTYLSPTDSYEDEIGPTAELQNFAPGAMRGMWSVADQQHANVPVTVLTSSGNSQSNAISAIQGGIAKNPVAPATAWSAVPSMIQNVRVSGPIMIQASVSVRSSVANDGIGVALYRDGRLIGNHLTQTTPATVSAACLVQLSALDNPPPGNHVYAMYWSPGTGTLVANSNQRNLYTMNLTPQ
jgi:hypothetical protein